MISRARRNVRALFLTLAILPAFACGTVVMPVDLALEDPSAIHITIPLLPPPNNVKTTFLVGGVETTITTELGLIELLAISLGHALPADISIDDIRIAGTEFDILGLLFTGTLCVEPDDSLPNDGTALINVLLGMAEFHIPLNTLIWVTDPGLLGVVGGPLAFGAQIDEIVPLSIGDMLALLGGGSAGLSLTQEIDTTLPPDTPVIGPAEVSATLTLTSTDTFPTDPLLDECEAFFASF
jgi:hypothetical protein